MSRPGDDLDLARSQLSASYCIPYSGSYTTTTATSITFNGMPTPANAFVPPDPRVDALVHALHGIQQSLHYIISYLEKHPVLTVVDKLDAANGEER